MSSANEDERQTFFAILQAAMDGSRETQQIAKEHADALLDKRKRSELIKQWPKGREPRIAYW